MKKKEGHHKMAELQEVGKHYEDYIVNPHSDEGTPLDNMKDWKEKVVQGKVKERKAGEGSVAPDDDYEEDEVTDQPAELPEWKPKYEET